jgi:hypothetical protein
MSEQDELVPWLRRRIRERLYLATHTVELGNAAEWTELSSGVLMTIAPDAPQDWTDGVWAMGDSSLTRLMEANDPRDTIARCETELAILDDHGSDGKPKYPECRCCGVEHFPCRTVRLVGYGYRFRDGYRKAEWEPYLVTIARRARRERTRER